MNYFSKFNINPQRRQSRKLLSNPRAMHASVLSLFPPDSIRKDSRVLWRLDNDHPRHTLYISSPGKPDFSHLVEQAGWESSPGESVEYTRFLQQITDGTEWLFRLQVNPTKSLRNPESQSRGTMLPLVKEEQQLDWILSRAANYGFEIPLISGFNGSLGSVPAVKVIENVEQVFTKHDDQEKPNRVTLRKSVIEGQLTVTDEMALRRAMTEGIGRAKSYGYGLLTLRRP